MIFSRLSQLLGGQEVRCTVSSFITCYYRRRPDSTAGAFFARHLTQERNNGCTPSSKDVICEIPALRVISGCKVTVILVAQNTHEAAIVTGYQLSVHGASSGIVVTPSAFVDARGVYLPSDNLRQQIRDMWKRRNSRVIGLTSEMMALEILRKAQVTIDGASSPLSCEKLRTVLTVSSEWRPKTGIFCDDLIALTERNEVRLLLLTEVKGTTLQQGLSHSSEAKMFYQLARTYDAIRKRSLSSTSRLRIVGVITVAIIYREQRIILNVLNEASALGYFPQWSPDGRL